MSTPSFTKGPWYVNCQESIYCDKYKHHFIANTYRMYCEGNTDEEEIIREAKANASLIATSPELYASEEKNLEFLKRTLSSYQEFAKLVKQEHPRVEIKDIELIVQQIEQRIAETDQLLKKARGEE